MCLTTRKVHFNFEINNKFGLHDVHYRGSLLYSVYWYYFVEGFAVNIEKAFYLERIFVCAS